MGLQNQGKQDAKMQSKEIVSEKTSIGKLAVQSAGFSNIKHNHSTKDMEQSLLSVMASLQFVTKKTKNWIKWSYDCNNTA